MNSRREWQRRRLYLQRQILAAAGLLPGYPRDKLSVETIRHTRRNGFATEVLLMETLPGYFVGGTVYRPLDSTQRWPLVLIPHGHWKRGRVENLPSYSVPALGVHLALQGYVAFSWDMVGYNDARQTSHDFSGWREQLWGFNPLGLQLWNSIRALDYALTRPDVNPQKVACTGASGGATQTILLTAVDERVTCSAPVNMISATYQGADPCEEAPNLRLGTNNVEIAAMMAPRPMLMVSCSGDWTRNTPAVEFPAVQRIYSLFDRAPVVRNAHFDADHNYDRSTRQAVYRFLGQHLQGKAEYSYIERELPELPAQDLLARSPATPAPAGEVSYDELFSEWRAVARRRNAAGSAGREQRWALRAALGCAWKPQVGASNLGELLILSRIGVHDRVPAVWVPGRGTPAIVIHPDGSYAARESSEVKSLLGSGRPVLMVDVFQTGLARAPRERGGRWYLSYNQTDDAHRVQDVITALSWMRSQTREEPELVGLGAAALWVVVAAAVSEYRASVVADLRPYQGLDDEMHEHLFVPCVQRAGGLEMAMRLNRKLRPEL